LSNRNSKQDRPEWLEEAPANEVIDALSVEPADAAGEGLGRFPETPEELNESVQSDEPDEDDEE
jgi:hypothetical protein